MPVVKIGTVVSYETPIGFHHYACDFAAWASRAHAHKTKFYSPVPYYLYCRALELALKAFLLAKGATKKQLKARNMGHDLTALLTKAKKLGLEDIIRIKPEWHTELSKANEFYFTKEFEYFSVEHGLNLYRLPSLPLLGQFCDELLGSVRAVCLEAAGRPGIEA